MVPSWLTNGGVSYSKPKKKTLTIDDLVDNSIFVLTFKNLLHFPNGVKYELNFPPKNQKENLQQLHYNATN